MNKKSLIAAILAASTVVAIPVISHAGNRGDCDRQGQMMQRDGGMGKHGGMMQGRGLDRMAKQLDLTDDQKVQIEEIFATNQEGLVATREKMQENRKALRSLDPTAADYDARVDELATAGSELNRQMTIERASVRKQISAVLNDEQREKMASFESKRGKFRE